MSCFVTRPPRPVPGTCPGSTPCSEAMRATTGETKRLPFSLGAGVCACAGCWVWSCWVWGSWFEGATLPTPSLAAAIDASAAACVAGSGDVAELRADLDRLALLDEDPGHRPARRARHLRVDLVGRDLEQRLVGL